MNNRSSEGTETIATREQVVGVLELLSTRMQWSAARPIISSTSLHVSRGWPETLSRAREDAYSDAIWTAAYKTLSKVARLHTFVGNKHVSFFDLRLQNAEDRDRIVKWAPLAKGYLAGVLSKRPFAILDAPTTAELLEPLKNSPPKLISSNFAAGKLYLQFFSVRSYFHRESLDISDMGPAQRRYFAEYEEIIGVKTKSVPCFDTVVVDVESELVEIRIDFQPGMTEDKNAPAFNLIVGALNKITTKYMGHSAVGVGLMNLHPAINPMYLDDKCGRVTALGFVATGKSSSSNNRGQILRTRTKDFRKDEFHAGGKGNVERVDPYAIGVTWPAKPPKGDLYLELKGSVRSIYAGKLSAVTEAEIVGCTDVSDFDFVTGQVLDRLKRPKK